MTGVKLGTVLPDDLKPEENKCMQMYVFKMRKKEINSLWMCVCVCASLHRECPAA